MNLVSNPNKIASTGIGALTAVLTGGLLLIGCEGPSPISGEERPQATAAAVAAGPIVQKYVFVAWGTPVDQNSGIKASRLAWGGDNMPYIIGTGQGRTNGFFYYGANGYWNPITTLKSTVAKAAFAVDPPSMGTSASMWYTANNDGNIYQATWTKEGPLYSPYKDVAVGNDLAAGNKAQMWAINKSDNLVYCRVNGVFFPTTMKAKRIAAGAKGVPWAVDMTDRPCYLPKGTSVWKCVEGPKATSIAAGTDANATVWMLGTDRAGFGPDYAIYRFDGTAFIRCNGGASHIAVGKDGQPWILNSAGFVYTGTPVFMQDPQSEMAGFSQKSTVATALGIGGDKNSVWVSGVDNQANGSHTISRWNGSVWLPTKGTGFELDVSPSGAVMVIGSDRAAYTSTDGNIWYGTGGGNFRDIGVGGSGRAWAVGNDKYDDYGNYGLWYANGGSWTRVTYPGAVRVDVGPDGHAWIVTATGDVWENLSAQGSAWVWRFGPRATDIGIGGTASAPAVWITSNAKVPGTNDYSLYKWTGESTTHTGWTLNPGGGTKVSVTKEGKPWIVNSATQVWGE